MATNAELTRRPVCDNPTMFALAPEVCEHCGNLIDAHRLGAPPSDILIAMWKIMIAFGGTHSQWSGGADQYGGDIMRAHMATCSIDFQQTEAPTMDGVFTSNDSFAEPEPETILNGNLYCACGKYRAETICIDNMTVGQLIWQVTHLDDPRDDQRDDQRDDRPGSQ